MQQRLKSSQHPQRSAPAGDVRQPQLLLHLCCDGGLCLLTVRAVIGLLPFCHHRHHKLMQNKSLRALAD